MTTANDAILENTQPSSGRYVNEAGETVNIADLVSALFSTGAIATISGLGFVGDAAEVSVVNQLTPAQWYVQIDGTVGVNDNDTIYESGDVSMYSYHVIENMSAGAGACDVWVSLDGTNYIGVAAAVELINDVTTGGGIKAITIPQNGAGVLRGKFAKIKVLQDGATAADARISHGVL